MSDRQNKPKNSKKINEVKLGTADDMDNVIQRTQQYLGEFSAGLEEQLDAAEKENEELKKELKKQQDQKEKIKAIHQAINKKFGERMSAKDEEYKAAIKLLEDQLKACKLENESLKSGKQIATDTSTKMDNKGNQETNVDTFKKVSSEEIQTGRQQFKMTITPKTKLPLPSGESGTWPNATSSTSPAVLPSTTQKDLSKEQSATATTNVTKGRISWYQAVAESQKFTTSGAISQATLRKLNLIGCFFNMSKKFQFLPQKVDELPSDSMEFAKIYEKENSGNTVSDAARNMYHTLLEEQDRQIRLGMIKIKKD